MRQAFFLGFVTITTLITEHITSNNIFLLLVSHIVATVASIKIVHISGIATVQETAKSPLIGPNSGIKYAGLLPNSTSKPGSPPRLFSTSKAMLN